MKYLVFSAYKGGVGRTTAAASIAIALFRCGRRVLIVDMDIDAPSLPSFFGYRVVEWEPDSGSKAQPAPLLPGGVVPWLSGDGRPDLASHLSVVATGGGAESNGSLSILPAGPLGEKHFNLCLTSRFRGFFEIPNRKDGAQPTLFARHFTSALQELGDDGFDYVLVDARSGLSSVTRQIMSLPAAQIAYFSLGDNESIEVLRRLRMEEGSAIRPVLSRAPNLSPAGAESTEKAFEKLGLHGEEPHLLIEQPDRQLEMRPTIPQPKEPATLVPTESLAKDHLMLMDWMLDEEVVDAADADPDFRTMLEQVRENKPSKRAQMWKLFENVHGIMTNSDGTRNVAFRVDTIESVFSEIAAQVKEHFGQNESLGKENGERALFEGGRVAGRQFGQDAADKVLNEDRPQVKQKLVEWGQFDQDVGFGTFQVSEAARGPVVTITKPFLTWKEKGGAPEIFEGYISGVLETLLSAVAPNKAKRLDLEHDRVPSGQTEEVVWKWKVIWGEDMDESLSFTLGWRSPEMLQLEIHLPPDYE